MSLTDKIFMGAGSSALPMRAPAGVGGDMAGGMKPQMQMAPGMPKPAMSGGLGMKGYQAGRAFNAPVQNQLGTMEFQNLQPRENPQPGGLAGKAMAAGAGMGGGAPSTNGFSAYLDEQIGAAGFQKSGGDRKAGWVAQSGAYKGKTREEAQADLRAKYAGMTPEQKAAYEAKGNNQDIGDSGSGMAPVGTPMDAPMKLGGADKVEGSLARRARMGAKPTSIMA